MAASFRSTAYLACLAVVHSSRWRRVTNMRMSVRTIASDINHAWYASIVTVMAVCEAPSEKSESVARKCDRLEIPRRGGLIPIMNDSNAGSAIVARMKRAHTEGEADGNRQAATSTHIAVGADEERRRLSSIFQRPIKVMPGESPLPAATVQRPKIQGSSCQSPRTQRC